MSRRVRSSRVVTGLIGLSCLCCLVIAGYVFFLIPQKVENLFGTADPALSSIQKMQYTYRLYQNSAKLLDPVSSDSMEMLFTVSPAEGVQSIANRLQNENLISSSDAMINYLVYKGYDRALRSGDYYLSGSMNIVEISEKIHTSVSDRTSFATIPGWRMEEIANSLSSYGFAFTEDQFLNAVEQPEKNPNLPGKFQNMESLEGFLFPGSYAIDREINAKELTASMVNAFDEAVTPKMEKRFEKNGLSLHQAVILASIIEKEAVVNSEKPIIASVFFNRLASGMNLETDPTVQYALGYNVKQKSWWTNPLTLDDLHVDSKFNTYRNAGLPPGPICSPGIESLNAVAFPADTHYYYFRSACDGSGKHKFATSLDEHIQNACP